MILITKTSDQTRKCVCVCVCVCVCCHPIFYPGRQTCGRTRRSHTEGRSHRIPPPSFCGASIIFIARKIRPFFPSSTVRSNFVYRRMNRSPLVGHCFFIHFCYFFMKNLISCECTEIRTHVPTSNGFEITTEPSGRPRVNFLEDYNNNTLSGIIV